MNAIEHIRRRVFEVTQAEMAVIAGTTQATISRWERGELDPNLDQLARIRAAAISRKIVWDDRLFFDLPAHSDESPQ